MLKRKDIGLTELGWGLRLFAEFLGRCFSLQTATVCHGSFQHVQEVSEECAVEEACFQVRCSEPCARGVIHHRRIENQMEQKMQNEMESGIIGQFIGGILGLYRGYSDEDLPHEGPFKPEDPHIPPDPGILNF